MAYTSKRTIVILAASVALFVGYVVYALGSHAPAPENLKAWAIAMLAFIGISIAAMILICIPPNAHGVIEFEAIKRDASMFVAELIHVANRINKFRKYWNYTVTDGISAPAASEPYWLACTAQEKAENFPARANRFLGLERFGVTQV